MYIIKDPVIETVNHTSDLEILKSWIKSRDQFLEIIYDDDGVTPTSVHNKKTEEIFPIGEYVAELMEMDLGFNYFCNITLDMTTSVALRDFIYMHQEYKGKWAKTNRYETKKEFIASAEAVDPKKDAQAFETYIKVTHDYENGLEPNFDRARETMPLSFQVNYQISLPVKQFVKILASIYINLPWMWSSIYVACYNNLQLRPWLKFIGKYLNVEEVTKYRIGKANKVYTLKQFRALYTRKLRVGSVLYSQMIRHENMMTAGYIEHLQSLRKNKVIPNCAAEFDCYISISESRLTEILKIRTGWWAVFDDWNSNNTWACFLRQFIPEGADLEEYKKYLMFFDSKGNFHPELITRTGIDDGLRLHKGYNAYFPDALALECRDLVIQRINRYGNNPVLGLYLQMFDKGYVRDNPNNIHRQKWEELSKE